MDKLPKVSILIPTYNQETFIEKAIASALQQNYENLEVVVSDDCSANDLNMIIGKYTNNPKFKYYRNTKNIGRVGNYRKCLYEYATGQWALCLDGDDYLTDTNFISDCVHTVMNAKTENKNIVFIQASCEVKNIITKKSHFRMPQIPSENIYLKGIDYFKNYISFNHFSHCSTFYNRKQAIETGFYLHDNLSTDVESFLKLSLAGDVVLSKKIIAVWVQHHNNASKNNNIKIQLENLEWIKRCEKYATDNYPEMQYKLKGWFNKTLNRHLVGLLNFMQDSRDTVAHSIKNLKILSAYIIKKRPRVVLNIRFIAHYSYTCFCLIKKTILK